MLEQHCYWLAAVRLALFVEMVKYYFMNEHACLPRIAIAKSR